MSGRQDKEVARRLQALIGAQQAEEADDAEAAADELVDGLTADGLPEEVRRIKQRRKRGPAKQTPPAPTELDFSLNPFTGRP